MSQQGIVLASANYRDFSAFMREQEIDMPKLKMPVLVSSNGDFGSRKDALESLINHAPEGTVYILGVRVDMRHNTNVAYDAMRYSAQGDAYALAQSQDNKSGGVS